MKTFRLQVDGLKCTAACDRSAVKWPGVAIFKDLSWIGCADLFASKEESVDDQKEEAGSTVLIYL
jgi:hypothetical protein